MLAGDADVVYGSRYLSAAPRRLRATVGNDHPKHSAMAPPWSTFRLGVCLLNVAARWIYGARLTDEATCYKIFSTEVLRSMELECERFEFCPEVTAKVCRMRLRIVEVPVRYSPRDVADGKVRVDRRSGDRAERLPDQRLDRGADVFPWHRPHSTQ